MGSYVPTTAAEREEMLAAIGVDSLEGLYKAVPQEIKMLLAVLPLASLYFFLRVKTVKTEDHILGETK